MGAADSNRTNNNSNNNTSVSDFNTYEEYLDSQITPLDMFYLEVLIYFSLISLNPCRTRN
jgi:hypothetical protein